MPLRPAGGYPSADGASLHLDCCPDQHHLPALLAVHRSVSRSCPLSIEELTSGSFLARLVCPDTPAEPAPAVPRWVLSCTGHTAHAAASHPIFAPNPVRWLLHTRPCRSDGSAAKQRKVPAKSVHFSSFSPFRVGRVDCDGIFYSSKNTVTTVTYRHAPEFSSVNLTTLPSWVRLLSYRIP